MTYATPVISKCAAYSSHVRLAYRVVGRGYTSEIRPISIELLASITKSSQVFANLNKRKPLIRLIVTNE